LFGWIRENDLTTLAHKKFNSLEKDKQRLKVKMWKRYSKKIKPNIKQAYV
jgi:hypothetical protein